MTGDATFTGNLTVTNVRATNVYVTGFVASNGYITYSDERYKLDVSAIPYGIDEIMQLNPVSYRYISHPDVVSLGFIAQEAMSVIPESVVMNPEGYYGKFDPGVSESNSRPRNTYCCLGKRPLPSGEDCRQSSERV